MPQSADQILTAAEMRAAEAALIADGSSVDDLMRIAGRGAAEWVWRMAAGHRVTVLCGPGNNGGDGYVIAEAIREWGGNVAVVAPHSPATDAASRARALYQGAFADDAHGEVLVDCLFGSGLTRPLSADDLSLLQRLSHQHRQRIAIDVPSGVASDSGMELNEDLPHFDLTVALGAWKFAHFLMPASARMGTLRLVPIGIGPVSGAALRLSQPRLNAPAADAHKYTRGLVAVVGGIMPGAAMLAALSAQRAGAGYIKLFGERSAGAPADLIVDDGPLDEVLSDNRNSAVLVGPGLGRGAVARERLATALADPVPVVLDADALVLLTPRLIAERAASVVATPHEGELVRLEHAFDCDDVGSKIERARALAAASGMVIVAKGPDTVIADPDGRTVCVPRASSWLSTAGTGDVLAGAIAGRLATGVTPFAAACEGVWLHGRAASTLPPAFSAGALAEAIAPALSDCL